MTITAKQKQILVKYYKTHGQEAAAAKAGMSVRTARKYLKAGSAMKQNAERDWRTHKDAFSEVWNKLEQMLTVDSGLQSQTLMQWLIDQDERFHWGQLRTLQRRIRQWRAMNGPEQEVFFPQKHQPGKQSQSDWTNCNALGVTIAGVAFPHLLFHFMLPYSRWETAYPSRSESFDELASGFIRAVEELGAVAQEHRTDNLSAAVNSHGVRPIFTERWAALLGHYGVRPSKNNPGESHENGSVEKSHDLLKNAIDQALRMRGSTDFSSLEEYEKFVRQILDQRNRRRKERLAEERLLMSDLPARGWNDPLEESVGVMSFSTVSIGRAIYSVPSRLIGYRLRALIYPEMIRLFFGSRLVQEMPRLAPGEKHINYRHVVAQLVRKPGAFCGYQWRDDLFPRLVFRQAYDCLKKWRPERADKEYLAILHQAAMGMEDEIATVLSKLLASKQVPTAAVVKQAIPERRSDVPAVTILAPEICTYDALLSYLPSAKKELEK